MKILLTGGAGYIGSHVSLELLDRGHQVSIIDNLVNGSKKLLPEKADFLECDIDDEKKISNFIKINKFEKILSDMDLIYNFSIYKFDNRNNFYKVIFNGTPDKFLEVMSDQNYDFEIKNKIWVLNDKS